MKSLISILAVLGFAVASNITAYGDESLFFYQASEEQLSWGAWGSYDSECLSYKTGDKTMEVSENRWGVAPEVEYGMTEKFSARIAAPLVVVGHSKVDGVEGNKVQGVGDPHAQLKYQSPSFADNKWKFFAGVGGRVSHGKQEIDLKEKTTTPRSGGATADGFVGLLYLLQDDRVQLFLKGSGKLPVGERTQITIADGAEETEKKLTGGQSYQVEAGGQKQLSEKVSVGAKFFYNQMSDTESKVDGGDATSNEDGRTAAGVGLTARFNTVFNDTKVQAFVGGQYERALSAKVNKKELKDLDDGSLYSMRGVVGLRFSMP